MKVFADIKARDASKGKFTLFEALPDGRWRGYEAGDALPVAPNQVPAYACSGYQFRMALARLGLLDSADNLTKGAASQAKTEMRVYMDRAETVVSVHPICAAILAGLLLNDGAVKNLFEIAVEID